MTFTFDALPGLQDMTLALFRTGQDNVPIVVVVSVLLLALVYACFFLRSKPYPPGPRPLPIVGNLFSLMGGSDDLWETFTAWKTKYGMCSPSLG